MSRIGIFGGSFNPVHSGHVLAAAELVRLLELDELLLIPAATPPHKALPLGSPDAQTRMELLQLAVAGLPKVSVCDIELRRAGKSYTIDTVLALKRQYPDDSLYLLMGTDMFLIFDQWRQFEQLLRLTTVCVLHRADSSEPEREALEKRAAAFRETYGARIELLENRFAEVSSTTARRMLLLGCGEDYLPPQVYDAVCARGLYGVGGDRKGLSMERLTEAALPLYDARRVPHALGCRDTAAELAAIYGADPELAARAGILHDITKALSAREQLRLCEKYGIMCDEYSGEQTKLLHAKTAAAAAKEIFGECEAVCEAISWHTTGRAGMGTLEKILYIADYVEPNRSFEGVQTLRELAYSDLDAAVLLGMELTIGLLQKNGRPLNRYTVEARDYMLGERK